MSFRQVTLPENTPGHLFLHSMPGKREEWSVFESEARSAGLQVIFSLSPLSEIQEKSPHYYGLILGEKLPWIFRSVPIPDFGVPEDLAEFSRGVTEAATMLRKGQSLLFHCGAGIGRTGTFAICVLMELGLNLRDSEEAVNSAGSYAEAPSQRDLILWFARQQ